MRVLMSMLLLLVLLGCGAREEAVEFECRLASFEAREGYVERTVPGGRTIYLAGEALLTNADVASAMFEDSPMGPMISVILKEDGKLRFAAASSGSVGAPMVILLDGEIVSAPIVRAPITEGRLLITGSFEEDEARRIAEGLGSEAP